MRRPSISLPLSSPWSLSSNVATGQFLWSGRSSSALASDTDNTSPAVPAGAGASSRGRVVFRAPRSTTSMQAARSARLITNFMSEPPLIPGNVSVLRLCVGGCRFRTDERDPVGTEDLLDVLPSPLEDAFQLRLERGLARPDSHRHGEREGNARRFACRGDGHYLEGGFLPFCEIPAKRPPYDRHVDVAVRDGFDDPTLRVLHRLDVPHLEADHVVEDAAADEGVRGRWIGALGADRVQTDPEPAKHGIVERSQMQSVALAVHEDVRRSVVRLGRERLFQAVRNARQDVARVRRQRPPDQCPTLPDPGVLHLRVK